MSLVSELKRRKVFRTCMAYFVLCWLVLQITDVMIPILDLPNWLAKLIFLILLLGLPIVAMLSWTFDLSDRGIVRDSAVHKQGPSVNPASVMSNPNPTCTRMAGCAIVGLTVLFSIGAASTVHLSESRHIGMEVQRLASVFASEMASALAHESASLGILSERIAPIDSYKPANFHVYAEQLLAEHQNVKAVEWVPRVNRAELSQFEEAMQEHYTGFHVKQFDPEGNEIAPGEGDIFFPVSFTLPLTGNGIAVGYDLGSDPKRAAAIERSIRMGKHQTTDLIHLIQTGRSGVLLFKPVFSGSLVPVSERARQEMLIGLVVCVIDLEKLIQETVARTPDSSRFRGQILITAEHSPDVSSNVIFTNAQSAEYASTYRATSTWGSSFGVSFVLEIVPSRKMVRDAYSSFHWWIAGSGLLISVLIALVLRSLRPTMISPAALNRGAGSSTLPNARPQSKSKAITQRPNDMSFLGH